MSALPKIRPEIVIRRLPGRDENYVIVKDPAERQYYKFEEWEHDLLLRMDGTSTLEDLAAEYNRLRPGSEADASSMADYVEELRGMGLLERTEQERHLVWLDKLRRSKRGRFYDAKRSSLMAIHIPLFDPDRLMGRIVDWIGWWWSPWFVVPWSIVFVLVLGFLLVHWDLYWRGFLSLWDVSRKGPLDWFGFLLLIFGVSIWHELGHGLTCKRFGGEVHDIGILIQYFEPAFYCNIDDSYLFENRFHRVYCAFGGAYFELMLCSAAMAAWLLTPAEWALHGFGLTVVLFSGLSLIALNLNPLIKLDGYYVLMDFLDVPNLREDSFEHIRGFVKRRLLHLEAPSKPTSRRRRRIYVIYGLLSMAYTATILVLLYFLVEGWLVGWLGPLGYLAVALLVVWYFRTKMKEGWRFMKHLWFDKKHLLLTPRGAAVASAVVLIGALLLGALPLATRIEGPFVVEPEARAVIRAPYEGMVRQVDAVEGKRVAAGEVLAVLENPDLTAERARAAADVQTAEREATIARMGSDAAGERARLTEAAEARERLRAATARLETLVLASPLEGVVATPRLEDTLGRHLGAGEPFCTIDRLGSVKLAVSVSEREVEEIRAGDPVRIRLESYPGETLRSKVLSVSPITSQAERDPYETPDLVLRAGRVRVLVALDNPGERLRPGMGGRVQFLTTPRSIAGQTLWHARRWASSLIW